MPDWHVKAYGDQWVRGLGHARHMVLKRAMPVQVKAAPAAGLGNTHLPNDS